MKSFLWITPKWPLPANDGARQATTQLISALTARGASIKLVALVPEGDAISESDAVEALGVVAAKAVRRPVPGVGLHMRNAVRDPRRALTLAQYSTKHLSAALRSVVSAPDTVIVFDGLHAAAWLHEVEEAPTAPMVYRAHNVEADIWMRASTRRRGIARHVLRWQGNAVQEFEGRICRASRVVLSVSDNDTKRFQHLVPLANTHTLPIGMDPKPQRPEPARDDELLFVGRLDWPPNRDGLQWFLERVWPRVVRPFTLTIVGSGNGEWLAPYLQDSRIRFLGQVDSVTPHYHRAIVSLVPIFYGSGTRVKAIESSLYATACLATERGVEGIGLEPESDYYGGETENEWVEALNDLDPHVARMRGDSALDRVAERYDGDRIAGEFLRVVEESA